jgi:LCP family protein required for cell wall assembly
MRGNGRRLPAPLRLFVAAFAVVVAAAATTVVFVNAQVAQLAHALGANQTLLLIGNDQRLHTSTTPVVPHANEMLLVRIDPGKPWISMMSIPRELQVTFNPSCNGLTTTRLNAALMCGGMPRVVSMIKQVTGLSINHVVEIDFGNFVKAVNEMGCVYGMIDRRYFHVNRPGGPQYFQVNLQPGYQKLCGRQALQFVTYRHDDTSIERDARDQDFLLEVKQQYGPTLIDNISKFENIFGHLVQTDGSLHTPQGVENLVGTLIQVASRPVRQVHFRANLGVVTNCACVTSTPQQIKESVDSFLYGTGIPPAKRTTVGLAQRVRSTKPAAAGLVPVSAATLAQAKAMARRLPFPLEMPPVKIDNGYGFPTRLRSYTIPAPGGRNYPIYVAVFSTGLLGQYYDVQGTTWLTAPIFDSPTQSFKFGGRTYYVYYDGSHIKTLAWFANGAGYWVQNTLTLGLTNTQMLDVAERTAPVIGAAAGSVRRDVQHQTAPPASVTVSSAAPSALQSVGEAGGFLAVLALVGGSLLLWRRQRSVGDMRAAAARVSDRLVALEGQLARAAGGLPLPAAAGAGVGAAVGGYSDRTIYRQGGSVRTFALAVVVAVVLAGGGVAVAVATGAARPRPRPKPAAAPVTAPVVVLNAGTTQGAAAKLARALRAKHLDVLGAGNLTSPAPGGYEILYTVGAHAQARRLARVLSADSPLVAPADPAAQAAAGPRAKVIVVIP